MRTHHPTSMLTLTVLAAVALAGCLAGTSGPPGDIGGAADGDARWIPAEPDHDFSDAIEDLHVHEVPALHEGAFGLELVSHDPLTDGLEPVEALPGGFTEVDYQDGLAVVSSFEGTRGLTLVNVTDGGLEVLSHVHSGSENWDARFSDDGDWLFMGCQGGGLYGAYTGEMAPGGCVLDGPVPELPVMGDYEGSGIVAINVSDPTSPTVAAYTPSGPVHNLYTATIDGTVIVGNNRIELFAFDPASETFEHVADLPGVHDLHIQQHPVTGDWLLYTGADGTGFRIYDISDPTDPTEIAVLNDGPNGEAVLGWHEQTPAPGLIDGRHVTVVASESFQGVPQQVSVVDTTDPTDPVLLGQWTMPAELAHPEQLSYKFSSHNLDVSGTGQVVIGNYHAGVWVFDVSTVERMMDPVTLAYYQPHELVTTHGQQPSPYGVFTGAPYVWGAVWTDEGNVLAPDMNTGLYLLEPTWEWVEAGNATAT